MWPQRAACRREEACAANFSSTWILFAPSACRFVFHSACIAPHLLPVADSAAAPCPMPGFETDPRLSSSTFSACVPAVIAPSCIQASAFEPEQTPEPRCSPTPASLPPHAGMYLRRRAWPSLLNVELCCTNLKHALAAEWRRGEERHSRGGAVGGSGCRVVMYL